MRFTSFSMASRIVTALRRPSAGCRKRFGKILVRAQFLHELFGLFFRSITPDPDAVPEFSFIARFRHCGVVALALKLVNQKLGRTLIRVSVDLNGPTVL